MESVLLKNILLKLISTYVVTIFVCERCTNIKLWMN